jgi:ATP-binding cassette subfamily B protein
LPVSKIRQYAGTDQRGTNVLGLVEAAGLMGMQARGVKAGIDSLDKIPLPAIAHIITAAKTTHYVVVYRVRKKGLTIMDPAMGELQVMAENAFGRLWTGVLLLLVPGEHFKPGNKQASNAGRLWQLINRTARC